MHARTVFGSVQPFSSGLSPGSDINSPISVKGFKRAGIIRPVIGQ